MGEIKSFKVQERQVSASFKNEIPRTVFVAAVEKAIADSEIGKNFEAMADELRNVAQTATKADVGAFRCYGSCGCPLTQAGIEIVPQSQVIEDGLPYQMRAFAGKFDTNIRTHLGYGAAIGTISIKDTPAAA